MCIGGQGGSVCVLEARGSVCVVEVGGSVCVLESEGQCVKHNELAVPCTFHKVLNKIVHRISCTRSKGVCALSCIRLTLPTHSWSHFLC